MLLLFQCAVRRAPEGGPPDKTPPELRTTFPNPDSTNVKDLEYIELKFNENLDRSSVRNQMWMLPEPPGGFEVEWKNSKTLRVKLKDSLETNRTYLLTLGTEVKDQRGNTLEKPVLLPFSTGETIDTGEIKGKLYASQPENTFIYAYDLEEDYSDSTIFKRKPAYYTQVSKTGEFTMSYLRFGRYRVFALSDQNRNGLYDRGIDLIGLARGDVTLDSLHNAVSGVDLTLLSEDLEPPVFVRASKIHAHQFRLNFSEPVRVDKPLQITVQDSASGDTLKVYGSAPEADDKTRVVVYTAAQSEIRYLGEVVGGVQDTSGNKLDTVNFAFTGSTKEDTVTARLIKQDPRVGAVKQPFDLEIMLETSQPLDTSTLSSAIKLTDKDSALVVGNWKDTGGTFPRYKPEPPLQRDGEYQLLIETAKLKSYRGVVLEDTTIVIPFKTFKHEELGEISGTISMPGDSSAILLDLVPFSSQKRSRHVVEPSKPYLLENIPEGKYRLVLRVDENGNGKWDGGKSLPFEFAEPFLFHPDTIKVRKRWTTEGISIQVR